MLTLHPEIKIRGFLSLVIVVPAVLRDQAWKRFDFDHYGTDRQSNQERYEDVGKVRIHRQYLLRC